MDIEIYHYFKYIVKLTSIAYFSVETMFVNTDVFITSLTLQAEMVFIFIYVLVALATLLMRLRHPGFPPRSPRLIYVSLLPHLPTPVQVGWWWEGPA